MRHPLLATSLVAGLLAALAAAPARAADDADAMLVYTVGPHDTLIGLNRHLFAGAGSWPEVARLNHLADPNRIMPGQLLRVPTRLLRSYDTPAVITSVSGDVRVGPAGQELPASVGMSLAEHVPVRTAPRSSAVLTLADGSRVQLAPDTEGVLDEHRKFRLKPTAAAIDDGLLAATLRLVHGSVQVFATKVLRARPLEVKTPAAVIGVRGTAYRVHHGDGPAPAPGAAPSSTTEVLEGKVAAAAGRAAADVPAGNGAALVPDVQPVVVPLLPAPDLSSVPARLEQSVLRLRLPGATPLRVQLAADAAFDQLLRDERVAAGAELVLDDIADGARWLRVRAIDPHGIEGLDAVRQVEFAAHPLAPAMTAPGEGARVAAAPLLLRWAASPDAAAGGGYVVEVSRDPAFDSVLWHREGLATTEVTFEPPLLATTGRFWWRRATLRAGATGAAGATAHGPWSAASTFEMLPPPPPARGQVADAGRTLVLAWPHDESLAAPRWQVQFATTPSFDGAAPLDVPGPEWRLALPAPAGTHWMRYRGIDAGGREMPWSIPAIVNVPAGTTWAR